MAESALTDIKVKIGRAKIGEAQAYTSSSDVLQAALLPSKGESGADFVQSNIEIPNELTAKTIREAAHGRNIARFDSEEELFEDLEI